MLQMLQSDIELVIKGGFVYLPLVFDPSIEKELDIMGQVRSPTSGEGRQLINIQGKYFLKSLSVSSILENYRKFDPQTYEDLRRGIFNRLLGARNPDSNSIDATLKTMVFQIIPHFARNEIRLRKRREAGEEFLDLVSRHFRIPARFYTKADEFADTFSCNWKIRNTGRMRVPQSGLTTAKAFRQWLLKALESRIIREEESRLGSLLQSRDQFASLQRKYIAVLLFVKEKDFFELNGSGFFRDGKTSEYYVYAHTGQYALKDYYGRLYLFPDCRVAVPTHGPLVPYVVEQYKHPFLKGYEPFQKICVTENFIPEWKFSASGAILALEEGINALFHGYNSRRGNGYHRLDSMKMEKISIVFDDLQIPGDDPRIISGDIEVKNDVY
jgi:hypothetical protein